VNTPARAPHIGVLISEVEGRFAEPIVDALRNKAQQRGLKLLFFPSYRFNSPDGFERQFNMMYRLVDPARLDGILAFTSTLTSAPADIMRLLPPLQSVPMVSVGLAMSDVPAIQSDNRTGFQALLDHFIQVHGYQRLAFMGGLPGNFDAETRLAVYRETLAAAGLPYDERLIVTGCFNQNMARVAMEELLARNAAFDALIAASDEMALAAISVAVDRGYHIPDDFAVGGFDDLLSISREGLSLTTVSQAVRQQAQAGLECLLARLRGEEVPLLTMVPSRLVVRRSCGCSSEQRIDQAVQPRGGPLAEADRRSLVIASLGLPADQTDEYREHLLKLESALFADEAQERFDVSLSDIAHACLARHGDLSPLQAMLLNMQRHLLDTDTMEPKWLMRHACRLQAGQIVIANTLSLFHREESYSRAFDNWNLARFLRSGTSNFSPEKLRLALTEALTVLDIHACYIGLYLEPVQFDNVSDCVVPEFSRLIFALENGVVREADLDATFPTRQLVAGSLFHGARHQVFSVFPVFQIDQHFGYMLFDLTRPLRISSEHIRNEISGVLTSSLLITELALARDMLRRDLDQVSLRNEMLTQLAERDELTGLYNRRGFFGLAQRQIEDPLSYPMIVIFSDIDDLKSINDTHGHPEGDFAIRQAAEILAQTFRGGDIVARIGGDEFVVLSPKCTPADLANIKKRTYERFDDWNAQSGKPYRLNSSIGYYVIPPDNRDSLDILLRRADYYLQEEKRRRKSGRTLIRPNPI
jgi:diguanylate cyclase (GGDEF)-like protein